MMARQRGGPFLLEHSHKEQRGNRKSDTDDESAHYRAPDFAGYARCHVSTQNCRHSH
jgi:hypothetical protein